MVQQRYVQLHRSSDNSLEPPLMHNTQVFVNVHTILHPASITRHLECDRNSHSPRRTHNESTTSFIAFWIITASPGSEEGYV